MELNNFTVDSFNKHKPYIYLLIFEKKPINIYQDMNYDNIVARTSDINFKLVRVMEIRSTNGLLTFAVEISRDIIGYFVPKSSIVMIPKKVKQVRVDKNAQFSNELNLMLNIDQEYFKNKKEKVAFSRYYSLYNNKIFESIVLKDEIIGFFEPSEINNMHKTKENFKITNKTILYRDNAMTKKLATVPSDDKVIEIEYIMPAENKLRFQYKGKTAWINISDTDYEYKDENNTVDDINELFLETILYQYKEKIDNYHKYYHNLLKSTQ